MEKYRLMRVFFWLILELEKVERPSGGDNIRSASHCHMAAFSNFSRFEVAKINLSGREVFAIHGSKIICVSLKAI